MAEVGISSQIGELFFFLSLLNSGHLYQMMMNYQWENIEMTVIQSSSKVFVPNI